MRFYVLLLGLLAITVIGCSSESGPVSLPVPFTGTLTADATLVVPEGTPVPRLGSAALKTQTTANASTSWDIFTPTGTRTGTITLFTPTPDQVETTPFSAGGVKRVYTTKLIVDCVDGSQISSSNFQVFEYPTDESPSFSASDVLPDDPSAVAAVRKAGCSGNNDTDGSLIDAKVLFGTVESSAGEFFYHTIKGSLFLHNSAGLCSATSAVPDSRVVMSIGFQGGGLPFPTGDPSVPAGFGFAVPLFFPGSDEVVGTELDNPQMFVPISPDVIRLDHFVQLLIGNSSLTIRNAHTFLHRIPELDDLVRDQVIATKFADDPGVSPPLIENGFVTLNILQDDSVDPINCASPVDATGIFRDLCDQHNDNLKAQLFCYTFSDIVSGVVFIEGAWIIFTE